MRKRLATSDRDLVCGCNDEIILKRREHAEVREVRPKERQECHAPEEKGTLSSGKGGKGGKVKSKKQAIAIGLSEARKKGAKVPKKKSTKSSKKKSTKKKSSKKSSKS